MSKKITIAVDGYSSTGKSTIAKKLAEKFKFIYIDSGAMYRMVALYALQNDCLENGVLNIPRLEKKLENIDLSFMGEKKSAYLNGVNVENQIRGLEVSNIVSSVANVSEVRKKLVKLQRQISKNHSIVMDGRDIGTVVFPDAKVKLFINCEVKIRAKRRYKELIKKGDKVTFEAVLQNIIQRDLQDTTREDSPLKKAQDAIEINNTNMNRQEQFEYICKLVKDRVNH